MGGMRSMNPIQKDMWLHHKNWQRSQNPKVGKTNLQKPTRICGWNVMGASSDRPIGMQQAIRMRIEP